MSDYYLSAATQTAFLTGMIGLGPGFTSIVAGGTFSSDFSLAFGGVTYTYAFAGPTSDGGSWKLRIIGALYSWVPSVTPQPIEPGVETNRVGLPIMPELAMVPTMPVGIEQPVLSATPVFWAWFSWNSGMPLPPFVANGITVYPYKPGNPPYQVNL